MESERHAAYREQETIASAERGYYLMTLQLSGQFRMEQGGRAARLKPGWFAIYDSSKPATLTASNNYSSVCIRFPKSRVGASSDDALDDALDDVTVTAFDCEKALSSAVWAMVLSLDRCVDSLGPHGATAGRTMMELITAMLRNELGQAELAEADPHDRLLQNVREYIDARLDDPTLTPTDIALAHYISTRYLQKLFTRTDWTVTEWIRFRRIERCRVDLADPNLSACAVSSIGMRWGVASPSHFGQVFKRATGRTPTEFRDEALK